MTIADKIRSSSDEEIARILWYFESKARYCDFVNPADCKAYEDEDCCDCPGYLLWLRQEANVIK